MQSNECEWIDQVVKMSDDHTGDREWLRWQLTRAYEAGKRSDSVTTPEKK